MGDGLNKWQRRRRKLVAQGRCPHCGQPCAPYYECEERRTYKRLAAHLRRLVRAGVLARQGNGYVYVPGSEANMPVARASGRKGDRRAHPRFGGRPMDEDELGDLLVTIISAHPQGVHELTLNAMLASLKLDARVRPS